jgi:hypothetical protein
VALDDIMEDAVSLCLIVGGLLVFDIRLKLDDAPTYELVLVRRVPRVGVSYCVSLQHDCGLGATG